MAPILPPGIKDYNYTTTTTEPIRSEPERDEWTEGALIEMDKDILRCLVVAANTGGVKKQKKRKREGAWRAKKERNR